MRLINTTTYKLHELQDLSDLKYAILSHRWEGDEIGFQEFYEVEISKHESRKSWKKIKTFCDIVAQKHIHWAWVDTCCIDKSSSAELSEAINSMYRWYENSTICIVYLFDVRVSGDLERSEWFSRGWTLQELIAPGNEVEFYTSSWESLGTREELCPRLANITGIPVPILFDPTQYSANYSSVAQRMSWASRRTTKREEDRAYCLLGLFQVNMPLIYGEGYRRAFWRLQLQIIEQSDDESIFAWKDKDGSEDQYGYRGMLAEDVIWFRESCNVQRHRKSSYARSSYTMTNRGFSIDMTLFRLDLQHRSLKYTFGDTPHYATDSVSVAPIGCTDRGEPLALLLGRDRGRDDSDTYSRLGLYKISTSMLRSGKTERIFVREQLRIKINGRVCRSDEEILRRQLQQEVVLNAPSGLTDEAIDLYKLRELWRFELKFGKITPVAYGRNFHLWFVIPSSGAERKPQELEFEVGIRRLDLPPEIVQTYIERAEDACDMESLY